MLLQSDGATPVLIDFGSMAAAERRVSGRSEALLVQDEAATHSTMPYRAPELFDVASDAVIDARVDGAWDSDCGGRRCWGSTVVSHANPKSHPSVVARLPALRHDVRLLPF